MRPLVRTSVPMWCVETATGLPRSSSTLLSSNAASRSFVALLSLIEARPPRDCNCSSPDVLREDTPEARSCYRGGTLYHERVGQRLGQRGEPPVTSQQDRP